MDKSSFSSPAIKAVYERLFILEGIIDLTKDILSASDFPKLLDVIVSMPDIFGYSQVFVYMVDDKQKYAVLRAGSGDGRISVKQGYKVPIDPATLVGWCILNNKAKFVVSDAVPIFPMPHSAVGLPLTTRTGKTIGAIEVFTVRDNLKEEYLPDFEMMADFISVAIENLPD